MFHKVLVANRGEIAVRVMRTCREMGIQTVAVFSDADRGALHVRTADEAVRIGPPPSRESYLNASALIEATKRTGADAVHPGYGFLSENPAFARACRDAGIVFIGPPPEAMEAMGEKTRARRKMSQAGVPVVPGMQDPEEDPRVAKRFSDEIGYPVMIKAASGGGGKGMRRVDDPAAFEDAFRGAQREALNAFGDGRVYVEKFLDRPRHVEIQIFADTHGRAIHLFERECSVQRRNQKVIEETPSCAITPELRERMGAVAVRAAKAVGYVGAGTCEFLVDSKRNFYFLEMNTRLQVEHPITELRTGLDLVRWQLEVAAGGDLPLRQEQVEGRGHAIEARINAEDPARGFLPSPGTIQYLRIPGGPGTRFDGGVFAGYTVPMTYDSLLAKLVVWAPTREQAIARMHRALGDCIVKGITTNLTYLRRIIQHPEFRGGDYDTGFLAKHSAQLLPEGAPAAGEEELLRVARIAAAVRQHREDRRRAMSAEARAEGGAPERWTQLGRVRTLSRGGVR